MGLIKEAAEICAGGLRASPSSTSWCRSLSPCRAALEWAGPKLKELVLERAANDTEGITFREFIRLCKLAYPETM